jgi:hypothetical protein
MARIYQRFAGLAKYAAEAYLCQITHSRLQIDPAKARKDAFLKFVPSGVAAVAELQGKGFAYLKVGRLVEGGTSDGCCQFSSRAELDAAAGSGGGALVAAGAELYIRRGRG